MKTEYLIQSYAGKDKWLDLSIYQTEKEMLDHEDFLKEHWKNKKTRHKFRKVIRKTTITESIVGEIKID